MDLFPPSEKRKRKRKRKPTKFSFNTTLPLDEVVFRLRESLKAYNENDRIPGWKFYLESFDIEESSFRIRLMDRLDIVPLAEARGNLYELYGKTFVVGETSILFPRYMDTIRISYHIILFCSLFQYLRQFKRRNGPEGEREYRLAR